MHSKSFSVKRRSQPLEDRCDLGDLTFRSPSVWPSARDQSLNHLRRSRSHVLNPLQPLPPHLPVDQAHVLLQVLNGPGSLQIRPPLLARTAGDSSTAGRNELASVYLTARLVLIGVR
jgi:hypothetical protein